MKTKYNKIMINLSNLDRKQNKKIIAKKVINDAIIKS